MKRKKNRLFVFTQCVVALTLMGGFALARRAIGLELNLMLQLSMWGATILLIYMGMRTEHKIRAMFAFLLGMALFFAVILPYGNGMQSSILFNAYYSAWGGLGIGYWCWLIISVIALVMAARRKPKP